MAAHDGGLVAFGRDLPEAFRILMRSTQEAGRGVREVGGKRRHRSAAGKSVNGDQ